MRRRFQWEARIDKAAAIATAEASGQVADSMDVRTALVEKMKRGEMTLSEVQQELKRIKRSAKKNGMKTRNQIWRES